MKLYLSLYLALPNADSTDIIFIIPPSLHPFNATPFPFQDMNQYIPVLETTKCFNTGQEGQQRLITSIIIDNSKTTHAKLKFLYFECGASGSSLSRTLHHLSLPKWNCFALAWTFNLCEFCFVLGGWLESPHKKSISSCFMWFVPHPETVLCILLLSQYFFFFCF